MMTIAPPRLLEEISRPFPYSELGVKAETWSRGLVLSLMGGWLAKGSF